MKMAQFVTTIMAQPATYAVYETLNTVKTLPSLFCSSLSDLL